MLLALAHQLQEESDAAFYTRGGLFVGDLEAVSAESVVEKVRVDLTRGYCDMLQCALALKGEW